MRADYAYQNSQYVQEDTNKIMLELIDFRWTLILLVLNGHNHNADGNKDLCTSDTDARDKDFRPKNL